MDPGTSTLTTNRPHIQEEKKYILLALNNLYRTEIKINKVLSLYTNSGKTEVNVDKEANQKRQK